MVLDDFFCYYAYISPVLDCVSLVIEYVLFLHDGKRNLRLGEEILILPRYSYSRPDKHPMHSMR